VRGPRGPARIRPTRGRLLRLLLPCLLAACGAPPERDPWRAGGPPPVSETVGWIDEAPVTFGDVARYLRTKDPEAFARGVEGVVIERITLGESSAMGVTIPKVLVDREASRRMDAWSKNVREASLRQAGEEVDPALWLQRVAGVSLAEFRSWVEHHTQVELIQDRLDRYEILTSARVEVSLIIVEDEARANDVAAQAKSGDFAALAKANSAHPSKDNGGRIPGWLVPLDIADGAVRNALFRAAKGEILGPFKTGDPKRPLFELYRIEGTATPAQGSYAELAQEVARDLERRPVDVAEYERWRTRVLVRHGFLVAEGGS
jgi:hypothetical protein